jgi:anti-sigma-K factor RskA
MIPSGFEELDLLAAEHVLGTLDARQTEEVRRALPVNPALQAAVEAWEARLAPMTGLALSTMQGSSSMSRPLRVTVYSIHPSAVRRMVTAWASLKLVIAASSEGALRC